MKSSDEPLGDAGFPPPGAPVPWSAGGELVPHLLLAERLDTCVTELSTWLDEQEGDQARETFLDLMVGLSVGAEAMRAIARGDVPAGIDHAESAVRHLEHVGADDIRIPTVRGWS